MKHPTCIVIIVASISFAGTSTWFMYREFKARTLVDTSTHYMSASLNAFTMTGEVIAVSSGKALIIDTPSKVFNDTMRVHINITPTDIIARNRAVPGDTVTRYVIDSTLISDSLVGSRVKADVSINDDGTLQLVKLQLEE
jgi:hypothetical protein